MKLTEDDIILDYECMDNILIWTKESEQLKQQILDDYEKARKWDQTKTDYPEILQNQKLRELMEKRIKEWKTKEEPKLCHCHDCLEIRPHDVELFEKLLEASKK